STNIIAVSATILYDNDGKDADGFDSYLLKPVQYDVLMEELAKYMKHTVIHNADIPSTHYTPDGSDDTVLMNPDDFENMMSALDGIRKNEWEKANTTLGSNDVEQFLAKLDTVRADFTSPGIRRYIGKLRTAYDAFDIVSLRTELGRYAAVLDTLRTDHNEGIR
ncbi:MAG: hypothetical protein JNL32_02265, partial [Candidatus Kapabacteria bacterium]|nr:hypothetical protein [Candidatus Kapabacteria bacterium]